jgi:hypothetical protein
MMTAQNGVEAMVISAARLERRVGQRGILRTLESRFPDPTRGGRQRFGRRNWRNTLTTPREGRRPYCFAVVLLVERGADVSVPLRQGNRRVPRDVRTRPDARDRWHTPTLRPSNSAEQRQREARGAHGDSPLSWASEHLRPGAILALLAFAAIGEPARSITMTTVPDGATAWAQVPGRLLPELAQSHSLNNLPW